MTVCLDLKITSSQTLLNKCLHSGSIVGICSSMVLLWCCSFKQCDINVPSILYLWITFCSVLVYLKLGWYIFSVLCLKYVSISVRVNSCSGCRSVSHPPAFDGSSSVCEPVKLTDEIKQRKRKGRKRIDQ